ncbi:hypothetical protein [Desulfotalea psychrophila]|uniref:Uncharacterized protein n=1 Tax=Desulfotalea psychrophila (strain LSv54 / DSM 12343) TaxID=177439 RepID=Q6AJX1_DESPS|nr:hypothetical protein [Desulfotalea psychrophila]CAG37355.1 unknown protein [Desulfotalea psychrophila LSv54]
MPENDLINVRYRADLAKELTSNRVERPGSMNGYNKNDIKRFRKLLDLGSRTAVIVGHTPLDPFASVWTDAGTIRSHHIVYSGHNQGPSIFTQSTGKMIQVSYPYEPLIKLINKIR